LLLFKITSSLQQYLVSEKKEGRRVGFVPTMGALHAGHISLIQQAKQENEIVVCSIFVNPVQFNDPKDLEKYPRPIEKDIELLIAAGCDILFYPEVEEMYPGGTEHLIKFDLGNIENILEGKFRPKHFQGVGNVVKLLLDKVQPNALYMGQKDFQQVMVVRKMMELANIHCKLVSCPIVREANGLAMSSRNVRLSEEERKSSAAISQTLFFIRDNKGKYSVEDIKQKAETMLRNIPDSKLDYLEIANAQTLESISNWNEAKDLVALTAIKVGQVRLIDNVLIP
jgi:pantoate--beta-alanine ligase